MRLKPYREVDRMPFSATPGEVRRRCGIPMREGPNGVGLTELDYGDVVYRIQASSGRLEEVTRRAPTLYLLTDDGVADVPFGALAAFVHAHDRDAFDRAGFLVSPRYGFAFVPGEPDWVTALAEHCIDTWRAM